MELRHAKRVVQPLIDGAFADEPVVVGLSSLSHHDEYTYAHSVNVCIVAVTMGHFLGLDRRALADLGVAALLHDVGKAAVYDRIRHPLRRWTRRSGGWPRAIRWRARSSSRARPRSTPPPCAACASRSSTTPPTARRAARSRDAPAGAAGYPALPGGWRTSRLSEIVSVADCFVSLQMHRSERGRNVTPYQALGMMLGPLAGRFDPVMLWALVHSVGFYPPGQLVELSDGRTALVLAPDKARPGAAPRARDHGRVRRALLAHRGEGAAAAAADAEREARARGRTSTPRCRRRRSGPLPEAACGPGSEEPGPLRDRRHPRAARVGRLRSGRPASGLHRVRGLRGRSAAAAARRCCPRRGGCSRPRGRRAAR